MSDIYLSITETPTVVTLTNPLISSNVAQSVTVTNVVSVSVVTMPAINVSGGLTNAELRASSVTVALDASSLSALEQVTVTVGAAVSISNFPSTQTVAGTVTANVLGYDPYNGTYPQLPVGLAGDGFGSNDNVVKALIGTESGGVSTNNPLPISGTVTANLPNSSLNPLGVSIWNDNNQLMGGDVPMGIGGVVTIAGVTEFVFLQVSTQGSASVFGTVTVGNSVTIGSLPTISGTVTARLQDGSGNNLTSTSIGGVQRLNVSLASAATAGGTLPSFINIHGGTDGSVARTMLLDSSGRTVVTVSNFPATQPVSLASTTVTVSALPSGALTTRFGSVTMANTAQITSAVTNTSRKYLLAQNISAGTVTIGIGFSPTTTQGIQLTAGGGLTFDTFCPTGAVYWLGAVTGAAFTILEG